MESGVWMFGKGLQPKKCLQTIASCMLQVFGISTEWQEIRVLRDTSLFSFLCILEHRAVVSVRKALNNDFMPSAPTPTLVISDSTCLSYLPTIHHSPSLCQNNSGNSVCSLWNHEWKRSNYLVSVSIDGEIAFMLETNLEADVHTTIYCNQIPVYWDIIWKPFPEVWQKLQTIII